MDRNEWFKSAKGGIAKLCRKFHLYDLPTHCHDQFTNTSTYMHSTKQIYFIFYSIKILMTLQQCGMTGFFELTTTDHRGLHMDLSYNILLNNKTIYFPSPFNRKSNRNFQILQKIFRK